MKQLVFVLMCIMAFAAGTAAACTDPSPKKVVKVADEATIVYEFFRPAKLADKKKATRPMAEIADSLLTHAEATFNSQAPTDAPRADKVSLSAQVKGTPREYREQAVYELFKIRSWADSICNAFRRGQYRIGPEDVPR